MGCSRKMELNNSDEDAEMQCTDQIHFPVTESGIPEYPIKMLIFGIPMFASPAWSEEKFNHVASILAEVLDQDGDGCADDPSVLKEITTYKDGVLNASVLLPTLHSDFTFTHFRTYRIMRKAGYFISTVEAEDETIPECSGLICLIFQDSGGLFTLPTNPVDGKYYGCKTCPDGPDHGGD